MPSRKIPESHFDSRRERVVVPKVQGTGNGFPEGAEIPSRAVEVSDIIFLSTCTCYKNAGQDSTELDSGRDTKLALSTYLYTMGYSMPDGTLNSD